VPGKKVDEVYFLARVSHPFFGEPTAGGAAAAETAKRGTRRSLKCMMARVKSKRV
jgi:hypothetical protein